MRNRWRHEGRSHEEKGSSSPILGLIKLKVQKGIQLAIRDVIRRSSDPYIIVTMGTNGGRRAPSQEQGMEEMLGLLKVKVMRGVNLAVRDVRASDPYVVVRLGKHKLKTRVVKKNVNPEWNEELTLSVHTPTEQIHVQVYDKDTFSHDDPMGDADLSIEQFMEVVKLNMQPAPNRTVIRKEVPNRKNCLADESSIYWMDGKIIQDVILRLRNVECGEVELQLQWVPLPNNR